MLETPPGDITECDSCEFRCEKMHRTKPPPFSKARMHRDYWFCTICWSTFASNARMYPDQYDERESMKMIAWVGNAILKALGKEL